MSITFRSYVEDSGLILNELGLPRMAGRMLGLIIISPQRSFTFPQLMDQLEASGGSVSMSARLLMERGLLERFRKPGDHYDSLRLHPDLALHLLGEDGKGLGVMRQLVEGAHKVIRGSVNHIHGHLEEMASLCTYVQQEHDRIIHQWLASHRTTSRKEQHGDSR